MGGGGALAQVGDVLTTANGMRDQEQLMEVKNVGLQGFLLKPNCNEKESIKLNLTR